MKSEVLPIYFLFIGVGADLTPDFASCALNRTISATWACRPQRLVMNTCMVAHATPEEQDRAREEWFATRDVRRKEREEKEKKRLEQKKFHNEWWGLDDDGKRILHKPGEEEKKK